MIEVYTDNEEDFVEKFLSTPRPCTIWMRGDLNQDKIEEISKRRGICFIPKIIIPKDEVICLSQG